ncbi:hypothetical protein [Paracoccus sp. PAR01]|uniref:hypothetical protein n=1 Tax=Paracoccus sp. PAR01 TaxID=2769282 RepID=UPI00177DC15E|nr:hypothetical protein [Paracoccus sp. PAR01]MBD9529019.1 hypothetical protein [Paracoccus sp. PAR01]
MTTTPDRIWVTPGPEKCNWIGDAYSAPDPDYDAPQIEYVRGGWQPIATAPKDGTYVLVFVDCWHDVASWGPGIKAWLNAYGDHTMKPSHWMPLPAAPEESA